jgi:nucleoid-associated protein YgaU
LKAFLFAGGGLVAAGGVAYVSGALDPYFNPQPPAQVAALNPPAASPPAASEQPAEVSPGTGVHDVTPPPAAGEADKPAEQAALPPADDKGVAAPAAPAAEAMKPAAPAAEEPAKPEQAAAPATPAPGGPAAPTFDVVRVEENGSVVVAGNAAPNAKVEIMNGATVLGSTTAGPDGAFAIVLDDPLKPGDYQLQLRATTPDNVVVPSQQTAVVSVPDKPGGQVLAMVEEPGKAAELMTVPEPARQPDQPAAAAEPPAPAEAPASATVTPPAAEPAPAVAEAKPAPAEPPSPTAPVAEPKVVVEAVEIDGDKIFVAGLADPGRKVRAYANEILLGDGLTSPDGHFLVEAAHDLPVGTYTVRVDALDAGGSKVVARATVPFEREPGESIAAVAPPEPAGPAEEKPAEVASAPPADGSSGSAATPVPGEQPATAEAAVPQPAADGQTPPAAAAAPARPAPATPEKSAEAAIATAPADGVPETVSPKLEHADGAVIIRRKDTLWRISRRVYGHGIRYSTIYLANQDQISDPDRIWPGQVFRVPEKSKEGEPANLKAMGEQATTAPAKTE